MVPRLNLLPLDLPSPVPMSSSTRFSLPLSQALLAAAGDGSNAATAAEATLNQQVSVSGRPRKPLPQKSTCLVAYPSCSLRAHVIRFLLLLSQALRAATGDGLNVATATDAALNQQVSLHAPCVRARATLPHACTRAQMLVPSS